MIALNKVDRLKPRAHRAADADRGAARRLPRAPSRLRAKTGDGVGELRDELVELLPEGPRYFPVEQRTDLPPEEQIARARPREGAPAHARGGAARDHRRGRGARREGRARDVSASRRSRRSRSSSARAGRWCGRSARGRGPRSRRLLGRPIFLELAGQGATRAGAATSACSSGWGSSAQRPRRRSGQQATGLHSPHGPGAGSAARVRAPARAAAPADRLDRPGRRRGARRLAREALDQEGGEALGARAGDPDDGPDDARGRRHARARSRRSARRRCGRTRSTARFPSVAAVCVYPNLVAVARRSGSPAPASRSPPSRPASRPASAPLDVKLARRARRRSSSAPTRSTW